MRHLRVDGRPHCHKCRRASAVTVGPAAVRGATAAAMGPGAVCGVWKGRAACTVWATAEAVGAVRRAWGPIAWGRSGEGDIFKTHVCSMMPLKTQRAHHALPKQAENPR